MQALQDGEREHRPAARRTSRRANGNELSDALVRARFVEEAAILHEHLEEVLLPEHQDMVEALPADAPEEALANSVRARSSDRCLENSRAHALRR
jgi:hypothetical protein